MTTAQATAEVFFRALGGLSHGEQMAFLERLLHHRRYREDLVDLATFEARRHEPSRPFREYLAERSHRTRRR